MARALWTCFIHNANGRGQQGRRRGGRGGTPMADQVLGLHDALAFAHTQLRKEIDVRVVTPGIGFLRCVKKSFKSFKKNNWPKCLKNLEHPLKYSPWKNFRLSGKKKVHNLGKNKPTSGKKFSCIAGTLCIHPKPKKNQFLNFLIFNLDPRQFDAPDGPLTAWKKKTPEFFLNLKIIENPLKNTLKDNAWVAPQLAEQRDEAVEDVL